jgi:hypothetical protein
MKTNIPLGYTLSQYVDIRGVIVDTTEDSGDFESEVRRYNDFLKQPLMDIKPYLTKSSIEVLKMYGITIPSPIIGTISELFDYCDLLELQNLEL